MKSQTRTGLQMTPSDETMRVMLGEGIDAARPEGRGKEPRATESAKRSLGFKRSRVSSPPACSTLRPRTPSKRRRRRTATSSKGKSSVPTKPASAGSLLRSSTTLSTVRTAGRSGDRRGERWPPPAIPEVRFWTLGAPSFSEPLAQPRSFPGLTVEMTPSVGTPWWSHKWSHKMAPIAHRVPRMCSSSSCPGGSHMRPAQMHMIVCLAAPASDHAH